MSGYTDNKKHADILKDLENDVYNAMSKLEKAGLDTNSAVELVREFLKGEF